jgi:hypothetical protein
MPLMQAYSIFQKVGSPNAQTVGNWLGAVIQQIGQARFEEILRQVGFGG